jgi:DNA-binding PadR family transcriptional regulator
MHYFWPRAESRIYDEAKRLVEQGLAATRESYVGKRRRTTYTITPEGRNELTRWLGSPAGRWFSLETEGILRLFLADLGSKEDVVAALEGMRADALEMLRVGRQVGVEYLEGRSPHQDIVHIRALVFDFLGRFGLSVVDWAERSLAEVESWEDLSPTRRPSARSASSRSSSRGTRSAGRRCSYATELGSRVWAATLSRIASSRRKDESTCSRASTRAPCALRAAIASRIARCWRTFVS